jgi:chromosome segregation ATPase
MTTTSAWLPQYLAALQARDAIEGANLNLYDYCTKLEDEKAELERQLRCAEKKSLSNQDDASQPPESAPSPGGGGVSGAVGWGIRRVTSPNIAVRPESPTSNTQLTQLRSDLAQAQKQRSDLQSQLTTLTTTVTTLQAKSKSDTKKVSLLTNQLSQLQLKLSDKDSELRGKAKLIEDVQDENVTLNLQLNVAEETAAKLRKENEELVDRWMKAKAAEADGMNQRGGFG